MTAPSLATSYLPDVVEEHFDDGCFALEQFEATLESPTLDLVAFANHSEPRLVAHVDALMLGGDGVQRDVLWPALAEAKVEQPAGGTVAAWALLEEGHFDAVLALIEQAPASLLCAARAAQLAHNAGLNAWLAHKLAALSAYPPARQAALLELAARRQIVPPNLLEALQHPDVALMRAAARAIRHGLEDRYAPISLELLDHPDAGTCEAALLAGLCLGLPHAWARCEAWALSVEQPCPLATQLYAALGTRAQQARLEPLCAQSAASPGVLFALGFSGNAAFVPLLLSHLTSKVPLAAKLAMQSLALIVGFMPNDDRWLLAPKAAIPAVLPPPEDNSEALEGLPALEDDDLDADLVPAPEDGLGTPNVEAIRERCLAADLKGSRRLLWGEPLTPQRLAHVLSKAPMRVRHTLAAVLAVRTRGALWLDTRALATQQERQLGAVFEARFAGYVGW